MVAEMNGGVPRCILGQINTTEIIRGRPVLNHASSWAGNQKVIGSDPAHVILKWIVVDWEEPSLKNHFYNLKNFLFHYKEPGKHH